MSRNPTTDGGETAGRARAVEADASGAYADKSTGASTGLGVWLSQVRAFTERCLREVANSWVMLITTVAFAAGMQLFFGLQWEGMPAGTISAMAIGTGLFGAIYVCLYVFGYLLASDIENRRYEAYRSMPVSPTADLSGRMLAGLLLATVGFSLTLIAGAVTGGDFALRGIASVPIVLLAFGLACAFWMIVALPIVVYAENERVAEYGVPMIAVFGYMMTGFNGASTESSPIEGEVLNYLPNTLPTRLLIYHLVPSSEWADLGLAPPSMPAGPEFVLLLVAYAAIALVIGRVLVQKALYQRGRWR